LTPSGSVGTLPWLRETRGVLGRRDRMRLLAQGALLQLRSTAPRLRRKLGLNDSRLARFDPEKFEVPDSTACKEAEQLCAEAPEVIVNHSYRSYLWSAILAAHDGTQYDAEVVYVASLLHDIGFAEPQRTADSQPCCFTLPAVDAAFAVCTRAGWDERRKEAAAEAIALHLNLLLGLDHGAEAYLVYAGTRLDATGYRYWNLHPSAVETVLARYPRLDLKRVWVQTMDKQAQGTPGTRSDFYTRVLRGNRFIVHAPFED
jgi:hypothetical protein